MSPTYPFPWIAIPGLVASSITGAKRNFRIDAQKMAGTLPRAINVSGLENVPDHGPVLITANHYCRPGFSMLWMAVAISSVVPQDICWVITRAWTYPGRLQNLVMGGLSRFVLEQIARDYQFISMPAMPPQPGEATDRAMAIRKLFRLIKCNPQAFIGLAPEGRDIPGHQLGWPPPGAGRLVAEIAKKGFQILPAGTFEDEECLCLNFGKVYPVISTNNLPGREGDRVVSRTVMQQIAGQLPEAMRGEFS
jgi:hypothetical protein